MRIAFIRILGSSLPLALLLYPLVAAKIAAGGSAPLARSIVISLILSLGFCAPLFFFHARLLRRQARRESLTGKSTAGRSLFPKKRDIAAYVLELTALIGLPLATAVWIHFF